MTRKALLIISLLVIGPSAFAETILLNSQETVIGTIIEDNEFDICVDTELGLPTYFYKKDIVSIDGVPVSEYGQGSFGIAFALDKRVIADPTLQLTNGEEVSKVEVAPQMVENLNQSKNNPKPVGNFNEQYDELEAQIAKEYYNRLENVASKDEPIRINVPINDRNLPKVKVAWDQAQDNSQMDKESSVQIKPIDIKEELAKVKLEQVAPDPKLTSDAKAMRAKEAIANHKKAVLAIGNVFLRLTFLEINMIIDGIRFLIRKFPLVFQALVITFEDTKSFYGSYNPRIFQIILAGFISLFHMLYSYPMMRIAQHLRKNHVWMAWIPGFQEVLLIRISERSLLRLFWYPVPFARFLNIATMWSYVAEHFGESRWQGLLFLLPGVNIIMLWKYAKLK